MATPCSRNGCTEMTCIGHSINHGYICKQCFKELSAYCNRLKDTSKYAINKFMKTPVLMPHIPRFSTSIIDDLEKEFNVK